MNPKIISIKLLGMAYVTIIHVVITLVLSRAIDNAMPNIKIDPETQKEKLSRALTMIFLNLIIVVIAFYAIRNLVEIIPFPLDGAYGYDHSKLKERHTIIISGFLLMYYQTKFRKRVSMVLRVIEN